MIPRSTSRLGAVATVAFICCPSILAGIADVKVTTDTSIDCSAIASIARDLYRPCKTDQEKAIATWYFVRRVEFHWPHIPTWDSIDLINSYGFGLCGYQSTAFVQICQAEGLKARLMHPPSHVIAEVFYDDAWHMFDCQVGWYVLNRTGKVASCQEIKADPTLVTDARRENRQSTPFFQCSDSEKSGVGFATLARIGGTPEPLQRQLTINLRRGESITRCWSNEQKPWFQLKDNKGFTSPAHGCTGASVDANDPVNWPYWKPYAQIQSHRADGTPVYGIKRYYGNGRIIYEPDLAGYSFTDGLDEDGLVNIKATYQDKGGPNLRPAAAGKEASATFVVDSAYVITDAWLDAAAIRRNDADLLSVSVRGTGGWIEVYRAGKTGDLKLEGVSFKDAVFGSKRYLVRFTMKARANAADVGVNSFKLTTVIMNNMYALPHFMPGKNTIELTAAEGADLARNKLTLDYAWWDGDREQSLVRTIDKLPFAVVVNVRQKDIPKMKFVKLSVAP